MANNIHPTAVIGPNVQLGDNNYIGPYCVIGMPGEHRERWGADKGVIIGDNNVFTGHVTIDSGIADLTVIGDNCFLMKHSHVGHDAIVCNEVVISCGAKIGGHVLLENKVNVGLNAVIHQHHDISEGVMVGMGSVMTLKVKTESYQTYAGNPARHIGPNKKYV
ncbi:hypothetical protein [Chitinophaga sp.]|uniref:hypothetical protein n=1 Tax=Chitinophaga sp. TaxID=1869181 RepID=UPI0031DBE8AB